MEKIVLLMSYITIGIGIMLLLMLLGSIVYKLIMNQVYQDEMSYKLMSDEYKLDYDQKLYNTRYFKMQDSIRYGRVANNYGEYSKRVIMDKGKMHYHFNYSVKDALQIQENEFREEERKQLIVA